MSTIKDMGDGGSFTNEDFEKCFQKVDSDGSGTVDPEEMLKFI